MKKSSKLILFGAFALTSSFFVSCTPGEKGAVIGGATGAAVGAAIGDGTGAAIGGAVGAVAGSRIAKKNARRNRGYYY